jgi:dimethylhistidine N-methyltransferase
MIPASGGTGVLEREPATSDFLSETLAGLSATPRTLPYKYFYDERGSELFGKICEQPEYYVTRTELALLHDQRGEIARQLGPEIELIGLGTGAGTKTRLLLEKLERPTAYIPVDISNEQLQRSSKFFRHLFPGLEILPVCTDYLQPFELPAAEKIPRRRVVYFPGSTIGNFEPREAVEFLRRIAEMAGPDGGLLIGVDLEKDPALLHAAYNDRAGVTAAFNLNLLVRANRELRANFDLSHWQHRAIYNAVEHRIEMNLISTADQEVKIGNARFAFAAREKIITEFSYKHSPEGFVKLAADAGYRFENIWTDAARFFGIFYLTVQS